MTFQISYYFTKFRKSTLNFANKIHKTFLFRKNCKSSVTLGQTRKRNLFTTRSLYIFYPQTICSKYRLYVSICSSIFFCSNESNQLMKKSNIFMHSVYKLYTRVRNSLIYNFVACAWKNFAAQIYHNIRKKERGKTSYMYCKKKLIIL